jgi:hypothetical protein
MQVQQHQAAEDVTARSRELQSALKGSQDSEPLSKRAPESTKRMDKCKDQIM